MNSNINDKLHPHERAFLLRDLGFKIRKSKGQINNIPNINYKDENPDLCINLDTGQVNDFGDSSFSGDVIDLIGDTINGDFTETIKYMEKKLRRKLLDNKGNGYSESLYGDPTSKRKANNGNNGSSKEPVKFWNSKNWKKMQKCQKMLDKHGIPKGMEYIQDYDGISLETLKEMKCGLYGYNDFEFGLSPKNYNKDLYFIFPYYSGARLYRRVDGEKDCKNIKGSSAGSSFFNVGKKEDKHDVVFIMKSPRECMSFYQYCKDWKIIGLMAGENVKNLTSKQKEQLDSIANPGGIINVIMDCNNPDDYGKVLVLCNILNEYLEDRSLVYIVNISKYSDRKYKDFTDLVQESMKNNCWNKGSEDYFTLDDETSSILAKSITKAKLTK